MSHSTQTAHPLALQLAGGAHHLPDAIQAMRQPKAGWASWLILPGFGLLLYLGAVQPLLAIGLAFVVGAGLLAGAFDGPPPQGSRRTAGS